VIEFRVLGPVEAVDADGPLPLGGPQQRALLLVLLLCRGELVSVDRLIEAIWGEHAPVTAPKIVQGYVSSLRKVLGEGVLVTRGRGYMLHTAPGQVDDDRFQSLVHDGDRAFASGDAAAAAEYLSKALALWRGPALADFAYEGFAQAEIARLEEARMVATERWFDAELELGHHTALLPELEALVRDHPLRERLAGQLMLAQYRSGRQAEALATYRQARAQLVDELGLEPGPELQGLEAAVLAQDPALNPDPHSGHPRGHGAARPDPAARRRGGALLLAGGGALLAAAIAAAVVVLTSGSVTVQAVPNSLAAIDATTNRVAGDTSVGQRPGPLAVGSGSVWVVNQDDQTVSQISTRSLQPLHTIAFPYAPSGIAAAGGAVWVAGSTPTGTEFAIDRVDPQYSSVERVGSVATVLPGSMGSVATDGGSVLVAPTTGALVRIDSATGREVGHIDAHAQPSGIAAGYGAVWVTDNEADNVTRIEATGLVGSIPMGNGPEAIAVGGGAVWVVDSGDDTVVRIDPGTRSSVFSIHVGHELAGIAFGDGSVWVADSGDGAVLRIDPASDRVVARIPVGGSPQDIAVAGDRVWVTVDTAVRAGGSAALPGTLRVDYPYDVTPLDPALAEDLLGVDLLYETCAKLVDYPDKGGAAGSQLIPEVAAGLPVRSANGRAYTFTIRPGFRFSPPSNQPVTAADFKYELERVLNPKMESPYADDFSDIVGARAYMAGHATDLSGVTARGDRLTIRLVRPAADLPARMAEAAMCAVPLNTPMNPAGVRVIPSAGPYRITSFAPGEGVVLTRNPSYTGRRPRRAARIVVAVNVATAHAIGNIESGSADVMYAASLDVAQANNLNRRYGPSSAAARGGRRQYFVSPLASLDFFALNTHRPLFKSTSLRRAVNYAIDRDALAKLGNFFEPFSEHATSTYIPPSILGYTDEQAYPLTPDLEKARKLAAPYRGSTVVFYTCEAYPCPEVAQIVKTDLAKIGLDVDVEMAGTDTLFQVEKSPNPRFDMAWNGWIPDWLDPDALLEELLEEHVAVPTFIDPAVRSELAAADRLTGTARLIADRRLDLQIARSEAPLVAFGNTSVPTLVAARIGCVKSGAYGVDLGALCVRRHAN
jgi:YVTN family beta-propeller protein